MNRADTLRIYFQDFFDFSSFDYGLTSPYDFAGYSAPVQFGGPEVTPPLEFPTPEPYYPMENPPYEAGPSYDPGMYVSPPVEIPTWAPVQYGEQPLGAATEPLGDQPDYNAVQSNAPEPSTAGSDYAIGTDSLNPNSPSNQSYTKSSLPFNLSASAGLGGGGLAVGTPSAPSTAGTAAGKGQPAYSLGSLATGILSLIPGASKGATGKQVGGLITTLSSPKTGLVNTKTVVDQKQGKLAGVVPTSAVVPLAIGALALFFLLRRGL